ncbi:cyclin-dependent kinase inhibitor 1B-like [Dermacentor albipictus]|uniref:cyclin-dependent kinase inhibitor 1B-like n=1 Tax=Dermacentor albipictus TaxID=60249 RepID=UPI0031FD8EDA
MRGTVAVNLRQMPMSRTLLRAFPVVRPVPAARTAAARRCLFDVDHEQVKRDLEEEKRARFACFAEAYNFDLSTETPLPGRFEWQSVAERPAAAPSSASEAGDAVVASETEDAEAPIAQRPQRPVSSPKQRLISDYFQVRKRAPLPEKSAQQPPAKMARLMVAPESVP